MGMIPKDIQKFKVRWLCFAIFLLGLSGLTILLSILKITTFPAIVGIVYVACSLYLLITIIKGNKWLDSLFK